MGGLTIETVRPGVQFIPDAAAAFRRANAQVRAEFGRDIDVNSTYRSWADQMLMFVNWNRYVNGAGPHPGHSKAVHPSESFHVQGLALDSDDWRNARIVEILADHGFIRNRLYVKGEEHHFEWLRSRDNHYGESTPTPTTQSENNMTTMIKANTNIYVLSPGQIKLGDDQYQIGRAIGAGIVQKDLAGSRDVVNQQLTSWLDFYGIPRSVICTDGIPRVLLNDSGWVLNPETNRYEKNGMWSWDRLNTAFARLAATTPEPSL